MNSGLRSTLSVIGLGVVCFLLARASCDQVLILFLVASIGWCVKVWHQEGRKYSLETRMAHLGLAELELTRSLTSPKMTEHAPNPAPVYTAAPVPIPVAPLPVSSESVRTIYKFPIHQLVRSN